MAIDYGSLVPDIGGQVQKGIAQSQEMQVMNLLKRAQSDPQALQELAALNPQAARQIQSFQEEEQNARLKDISLAAMEMKGRTISDQILYLEQRRDRQTQQGDQRGLQGTEGMLALLKSGDPQQVSQAQDYIDQNINAGIRSGLVKPERGEVPTSFMREMQAAGITPGTPEFRAAVMKKYQPQQTTINLGKEDSGLRAEKEALAKSRATTYEAISAKAETSRELLGSLDIMDAAQVRTGKLEPMKQGIAAWGSALGVDTTNLANIPAGQAFTAEASKVVLATLSTQRGQQTDRDTITVRETISNLGNDPKANEFINNSARAQAKRTIEQEEFWTEYADRTGSLQGVQKAWNDYKRDTPMVSRYQKTPEGLPIFYFQFEEQARKAYPDIDKGEIIKQWNQREEQFKKLGFGKPEPKLFPTNETGTYPAQQPVMLRGVQ